MAALGEMACWLPLPSGFTGYATRFCDPALGFALGWNYWFKYIIVTPNNLTAASLVIQYWVPRERINPGAFIAIFLVAVILINYFGIKFFGEFEFYLSSIKVVVILALIILSLVLACGGGPNGHATGFEYWKSPGAFHEYILTGNAGRFLAVWSVFTTAVFAFLGTTVITFPLTNSNDLAVTEHGPAASIAAWPQWGESETSFTARASDCGYTSRRLVYLCTLDFSSP
jgi:amino acid transporter